MHAFIYFGVVLIQFVFGQIYFLLLMLTLCIAFNCVNALFVCFLHIFILCFLNIIYLHSSQDCKVTAKDLLI